MRKLVGGVLALILTLLYPVAIWVGLMHFSARAVGLLMVGVVTGGVLFRFRRQGRTGLWNLLRIPLAILLAILPGIIFDDQRFVLITPVLVNAMLLWTFGSTLWAKESFIESIARMRHKGIFGDDRVAHCRQVTWAWSVFFVLNGLLAGLLALLAPVSVWAAYTGGISYALMGLLFGLEYVLRQYRFRDYGPGPHDRLLARIFPAPEETT